MLGRMFGPRLPPPADVAGQVPEDVVLRTGRWLPRLGGWLAGQWRPAAAVTLGRTVIVHPTARLSERLLRHELAHVRQWRKRPFSFPIHYAMMHLRHGYRANPYEVEARDAERGGIRSPDTA